jgi:hypothetical protein
MLKRDWWLNSLLLAEPGPDRRRNDRWHPSSTTPGSPAFTFNNNIWYIIILPQNEFPRTFFSSVYFQNNHGWVVGSGYDPELGIHKGLILSY